jgi:hypothetical protein
MGDEGDVPAELVKLTRTLFSGLLVEDEEGRPD